MTSNWTKLRDGRWGVRITDCPYTAEQLRGTLLSVPRRDGTESQVLIRRILWTGPGGAMLCAIESTEAPRPYTMYQGRRIEEDHGDVERPVRGCGTCARLGRMCPRCEHDET